MRLKLFLVLCLAWLLAQEFSARAQSCVVPPTTNWAPTNVTVQSANSTLIAAARCRNAITIINNGSVTVYLYSSNAATSTNGGPLIAGASITLQTNAAVWGIAASSTDSVTAWETF